MIAQSYLNELTGYTKTKIAKVVLNGSVEIADFLVKDVSANTLTLEYMVRVGSVPAVSKVELKGADGLVIGSKIVNVPIVEDTILRHVITVEEVV